MQTQVRVYRLRPGAMDTFVQEWREHVAPLRRRFGFEILAAWGAEEEDTFIWVIGHDGDFASADREYYASAERAAFDPDPARHILEPRAVLVRSIPLG